LLARTLQNVEDMSFDTLSVGVPWGDFETFPQYLDAIERKGVALNFGCYVGHTAVRLYVMGEEAYDRAASDHELEEMQGVIARAIDGGAIGFASSASPTHNGDGGRPVPSRVADLAELTALLEPLHEANRGVVALLPGGVISFDEVFDLQARIQRPFTWTALLTVKGFPYHEKLIERHDEVRARGIEVWPQISVRPLVFQMNLLQPFTMNTRASFSRLMALDLEGRIAHYRDPEWRAQALEDLGQGLPFNWASLSVAESGRFPELVGRGVVELASERGCTPLDVVLDISLEEDLQTRFWSVLANDDADAIAWLLRREGTLLGLADSGAHVSQLCDACFATDLLGNWVREKEVLPLERAIYKLTAEPARVFGLADRGTVEVGKAADVCVFDAETVDPGPLRRLYDFPANGERLTADAPTGMNHVLVNGTPIRIDGVPESSGERPGVVLRGEHVTSR
jgi:N-acyl-D-aspartate/D-glutamate deacylase